jgi:hypothetical protein
MKLQSCEIGGCSISTKAPYDFKKAIKFGGGVGSSMSCPHNAIFNFSGSSFSVSLWIKPIVDTSITATDISWKNIIGKNDLPIYQAYTGWMISLNNGGGGAWDWNETVAPVLFAIRDSTVGQFYVNMIPSIGNFNGKWLHLVGVYNQPAQTIEGWVNGRMTGKTALTAEPSFNNASNLTMDFQPAANGQSAIQKRDDIVLYTRVLTSTEITNMYGNGNGGVVPNYYLCYWNCEDAGGTTITDIGVNAKVFTMMAGTFTSESHYG